MLPEPSDQQHDHVDSLGQLLSAVIESKAKWPEGTKDFKNYLLQMKKALQEDSFNHGEDDNLMINTSSKPKEEQLIIK